MHIYDLIKLEATWRGSLESESLRQVVFTCHVWEGLDFGDKKIGTIIGKRREISCNVTKAHSVVAEVKRPQLTIFIIHKETSSSNMHRSSVGFEPNNLLVLTRNLFMIHVDSWYQVNRLMVSVRFLKVPSQISRWIAYTTRYMFR